MSGEAVELTLEFRRELIHSLVFYDGDREYVLPKSEVETIAVDDDVWIIEIPEWLAIDRGLV